ncbi:hypothetical protein [Sporosarcina aquimarina]|uniref:Spore coat protein n=1 Tax=Sporosarcina aquimarina TaxID=114975 RepID=A0ABU4G505_9BACL|nr:hypothetical protein [Sporosarcina aquimarina]MDW0111413.1 hypothetical protein [Sporosarcina aquimarina]
MASISLRAPLLFIDGPEMVTIFEVSKEESTSIYWVGNDPELVEATDEEPVKEEVSRNWNVQETSVPLSEQLPDARLESSVTKKLRYLAEPFPRTAYRPLQFLVNGQLLTGGIESLSGSQVAIEVTNESKDMNEVRMLDLQEIEEVFWKGSPFT